MVAVCSGLDIWRCKIPELVQNLEESAIQANTTSERLALQLQSVELQISMVSAFIFPLGWLEWLVILSLGLVDWLTTFCFKKKTNFYNCIAPMGFLLQKIQVAFPGKASCDIVALPNLLCMLGLLVFP